VKIHPGIRIDKIPVKGPGGLIFTVGMVVLFLIALPETRWFLLISVSLGIIVGLVLYLIRRDR
jgi:hypothetical protein